jgi:hypothetical protein
MDQELNDRLLYLAQKPTPVKIIYEPLLETPSIQTRYSLPAEISQKELENKRKDDYLNQMSKRHYDIDLESTLRNRHIPLVKGQQNNTYKPISNIKSFTPGITMNTSSSNTADNVFYYL